MTTVIRKPIKSDRLEDDPRPWFDLSWDMDSIQVGSGNSCFGLAQKGNHPRPINRGICQRYNGELEDVRGLKYAEQHWVFCMLMDGEYAFMPGNELPPILMAHLGIYDPVTDTLTLLEFVDRVIEEEDIDTV